MYLKQLLDLCDRDDLLLEIVRDPTVIQPERWQVKVYPSGIHNGHYYSFYDTLEKAAHKILQEMDVL